MSKDLVITAIDKLDKATCAFTALMSLLPGADKDLDPSDLYCLILPIQTELKNTKATLKMLHQHYTNTKGDQP